MSALALTMFDNIFAKQPHEQTVRVGAVAEWLGDFVDCTSKSERARSVPLWSPVRYREGTTRGAVNVEEVHWLVLDYDDGTPIDVVRERWAGWVHIGHTSFSHMRDREPTKKHPEGKPAAPALRVVLPLLEPVPADVWSEVMRGILASVGREADTQCIDPSRVFYVPCAVPGAPRSHWVHMPAGGLDGPWLCLADEARAARAALARKAREEEERRRQIDAKARDIVESRDEQSREVRRRLFEDPSAREAVGAQMGGRRIDRPGGAIVHGVVCPGCNRPSMWWRIDPSSMFRAVCEHQNTCGLRLHIHELATLSGLALC